MKRIYALGLALIMTLTCVFVPGCSSKVASADKGTVQQLLGGTSQSAPDNSQDVEVRTEHVREYGQTASYLSLDGTLTVRVTYPDGDVEALDEAVYNWIDTTAQSLRGELEPEKDNGSFTADFDSYQVSSRVVSVRMAGRVAQSHTQRPKAVFATFHVDTKTGELLYLNDLLVEGGDTRLQEMVMDRVGDYPYGQSPLSSWLLTAEGLRLYLPDNSVVEFTYEELEGILELPGAKGSSNIDPNKPMVALTFDDGPYDVVDNKLLDLLEQYGVKATFFVVGNRLQHYPDIVERMVADGHEIGVHTWEHATLTKLDEAGIIRQIDLTQEALQNMVGYTCDALRPPGGAYNDFVKQVVGSQGMYLANWSVDTLDWKYRDADSVYEKAMSGVHDGAIILCHDLYESTAAAMERVIPELIERGYQLVTLSELLSYSESGIVDGKMYLYQ